MPISGLLLTLAENLDRRDAAMRALADEPRVTIGEAVGARLPIVVETASSEEDRRVWDWLHELPGVRFVEIACIHFDNDEAAEAAAGTEVES